MKKIVSLLLCFCMLFALAVIGTAEETETESNPVVHIRYEQGYLANEAAEIARSAYVHVEVLNCPDFEKCEIVMHEDNFIQHDPNPDRKIFDYYDHTEEYDYSHSVNSTNTTLSVVKEDAYRISLQAPLSGKLHPFAHIMFATTDRTVSFAPVFESIRLFDADGEIDDFEVVTTTQIGKEIIVPCVSGYLSFKTSWNTDVAEYDEKPFGTVEVTVGIGQIHSVSGMEAIMVYNPDVLQPVPKEIVEEESVWYSYRNAEYELIEPGKIRIFYAPQDYVSSFSTILRVPFEFVCIAEGETGLAIESYNWLYYEYNGNYASYYLVDSVCDLADYRGFEELTEGAEPWVRDETNWYIPQGSTVADFKNNTVCNAYADICVYAPDGTLLTDDEIIYSGCVYKVFYEDEQKFERTLLVQYDVNCDGYLTSADARYALRASVGLETNITDAQINACGLMSSSLSADIARLILRRSLGL